MARGLSPIPNIALDAITRQQATFTRRDLAMFVHRHSDGLDQFNAVMGAVEGSPELVRLGRDGRGEERFTSREMIGVEERLHRAAEIMAERERHRVREDHARRALERAGERGLVLSREQRSALAHVTEGHDLGIVVGYAGSGKSAMLGVAREAWEESGYQVRGLALSGIAAENLESGSGIASRTIASMEHQWAQGRELLSDQDVLVIDEAGMIGSRQMERVLSEAQRRGAKVVLVGDPEQLQAIEAGAAFRSLVGAPCPCRGPGYPPPAGGLAAGRHPAAGHRPDRRSAGCLPRTRHGPAGANPGRGARRSGRRLGPGPALRRRTKPASS